MADEEFNPYASSDAPVAAEEVPPTRLRFYLICLACAVSLAIALTLIETFKWPDALVWTSLLLTWPLGVLWILLPDLRKAGGIRNVPLGRLVITILGVPVFTATLLFIVLMIGTIVLGPHFG